MKTECSVIKDLMPVYIRQETSDETNEFIEIHLNECEDCSAHFIYAHSSQKASPGSLIDTRPTHYKQKDMSMQPVIALGVLAVIFLLFFIDFPLQLMIIITGVSVFIAAAIYLVKALPSPDKIQNHKTVYTLIFLISSMTLLISLRLFWGIFTYTDSQVYLSPAEIYGGEFWQYMAWVGILLIILIIVISGIKIFRSSTK